jgi:hypothetical protein
MRGFAAKPWQPAFTMKKTRKSHFPRIKPIAYEGSGSTNPLAFHHYNPDEVVDGTYLLSLQVPPLFTDAAPSRPVLFVAELA